MTTRRGGDIEPSLHWLTAYPQAYELGMAHAADGEDMAQSATPRPSFVIDGLFQRLTSLLTLLESLIELSS
jgi:hypothetical protein